MGVENGDLELVGRVLGPEPVGMGGMLAVPVG